MTSNNPSPNSSQGNSQTTPRKKGGWKKWVATAAVAGVLATGGCFYKNHTSDSKSPKSDVSTVGNKIDPMSFIDVNGKKHTITDTNNNNKADNQEIINQYARGHDPATPLWKTDLKKADRAWQKDTNNSTCITDLVRDGRDNTFNHAKYGWTPSSLEYVTPVLADKATPAKKAVASAKSHSAKATQQTVRTSNPLFGKADANSPYFYGNRPVTKVSDGGKMPLYALPSGEIIELPTNGPVVTYRELKHRAYGLGKHRTQVTAIVPYNASKNLLGLDMKQGGKGGNAIAFGAGAGVGSANPIIGVAAGTLDYSLSQAFDQRKPGFNSYASGREAAVALTRDANTFSQTRNHKNIHSYAAYGAIDTDGNGTFETPITVGITSSVALENVKYYETICNNAILSLEKKLGAKAGDWAFRFGAGYALGSINGGGNGGGSTPSSGISGSGTHGSAGYLQ